MSLLCVNESLAWDGMRRHALMMLGYILMLTIAIPAGAVWLTREILHKGATWAESLYVWLEYLLDSICRWDTENRQ